ncbi:MAG: 5-formyltetrahydrofolate cyclo-ligase [Calditerrivibrio sp.]|nr:5-formyltetrahydrofolate cyclo-ligase [Calditerrivibrio sp.]MCA1933395.1 5-formyltetrahydrofolate cyclo-ligase [Calditerrivibrio sp.]
METKIEIRKRMIEARNSLKDIEVETKSMEVRKKFLDNFSHEKRFLFYYDVNKEVRTKSLIDYLHSHGKDIFLPKFDGEKFVGCFYEGVERLLRGLYGIMEPLSDVTSSDYDVIVMPGVAFGEDFNRVGMGKGFYDEMLKRIRGYRVGFAYQFQMFDTLPSDEWDEKVDMIITEEKIYRR